MSIYFITTVLLIVSVATNLTVEGIKILLNETTIQYSSNLLAAGTSAVIAIAMSLAYLVTNDVSWNMKFFVEMMTLTYLSFLSATVGYDKVIQAFVQIKDKREGVDK